MESASIVLLPHQLLAYKRTVYDAIVWVVGLAIAIAMMYCLASQCHIIKLHNVAIVVVKLCRHTATRIDYQRPLFRPIGCWRVGGKCRGEDEHIGKFLGREQAIAHSTYIYSHILATPTTRFVVALALTRCEPHLFDYVPTHNITLGEYVCHTKAILIHRLVDVLQRSLGIAIKELLNRRAHSSSIEIYKLVALRAKANFLGIVDDVCAVTRLDALQQRTIVVALLGLDVKDNV